MLETMDIFGFEVDSWTFMICLGVIAALVCYRVFSSTVKLSDKSFRFYGVIAVAAIIAGFFSAWLFQGIYDLIAYGESKWKGVTFMGGLVGGVVVFLALSLIITRGKMRQEMWKVICIGPLSITAAHAFGRIGCFMAGCCYGKRTNSFIGVVFTSHEKSGKVIPTQLIEAIFLALLFCALLVLLLRKKYSIIMIAYLYAYSVFRFIIEFYRDDERGQKGFFSPSQWQSLLMFSVAIGLTVYIFALKRIPLNGKKEDLSKKQLSEFLE